MSLWQCRHIHFFITTSYLTQGTVAKLPCLFLYAKDKNMIDNKELFEKTYKLTAKQIAFATEYVKTGVAMESARRAGYSGGSIQKYASQLLHTPKVKEYIALLMKEAFLERLMSLEEALALTASIARGEPKVIEYKRVNKLTDKVTIHREITKTPSIEEQQRSLEHVLRCAGAFNAKPEDTSQADGIERFKCAVADTATVSEVFDE